MKKYLTVLFLFLSTGLFAQSRSLTIMVGGAPRYFVVNNNIYEDSFANPGKHVYTIRGNCIYKGSSTDTKAVVLTFENNKLYKGSVKSANDHYCYVQGNSIYLKTKTGKFALAGNFERNDISSILLLGYLDCIEYIALIKMLKATNK